MSTTLNLPQLKKALRHYASPTKAKHSLRYFKTGPGEYGEGDQFLGLTVPQVRIVSKQGLHLPLKQIETLLQSRWHEERLLALMIMVQQYRKGSAEFKDQIFKLYDKNHKHINNWDLIDGSAPTIVGKHSERHGVNLLYRWAKSPDLWHRRSAVLGSFWFIKQKQFAPILKLAKMLLKDEHDLMHKAVGWMLREMGKRELAPLLQFLDKHSATMPRTMLRYALEKLPEKQRKHYMDQAKLKSKMQK